jgi:exo-beta-1,3-glucanase (GH17 family)
MSVPIDKQSNLAPPVQSNPFVQPAQRRDSVTLGYVPHAMTYSPFNNDNTCKSESEVLGDIQKMASKGVQSVRVYATECNTLYTVAPALKACGMKLIQGFYITNAGVSSIDSQVEDFVSWMQSDPSNNDLVEMLIVGNEAIMNVCFSSDEADLCSTGSLDPIYWPKSLA